MQILQLVWLQTVLCLLTAVGGLAAFFIAHGVWKLVERLAV